MKPKVFTDGMKNRLLSPWGFVLLFIGLGLASWLLQARAAGGRDKPYKYELIEEFQGTRIIHGIIDPTLDAHEVFIEKDGEKQRVTVYLLADYVNRKYAAESADGKIDHFVRLFNPYKVKIIESVTDIPGYAPDQLDPDINPDAIKTYSFTLDRSRLDQVHPHDCIVKYAWEGMGDIQRFRFQLYGTSHELRAQEVAVIQREVGDHGGLD